MSAEILKPKGLAPGLGYAHAVWVGQAVYLAGQIGADPLPDGRHKVVEGGLAAQFEKALANVVAVAKGIGAAPTDVAEMTIFITDMPGYRDARKTIGEAWKRHMGRHYPAMTLVAVDELFESQALVEIRAVLAVKP